MLHRLEAADHRFDTRADLFVLLQQLRPLGGQRVLTGPEGPIFFLQVLHCQHQFVQTLLQTTNLKLDLGFAGGVAHTVNIGFAPRTGQRNAELYPVCG